MNLQILLLEKINKCHFYFLFFIYIKLGGPEKIIANRCDKAVFRYDKLSAIDHTSVPRPSQKSEHLLVHPRDLGKVALESSLQELSSSV